MLGHYTDVIISVMASQITSVAIVCSIACLGAYQRKHKSSASLAFLRGLFSSGHDTNFIVTGGSRDYDKVGMTTRGRWVYVQKLSWLHTSLLFMYIIILAISQACLSGNVDTIHVNRFLNARKSYVILRHTFPNHRPSYYYFHTNFVPEYFIVTVTCRNVVKSCYIVRFSHKTNSSVWCYGVLMMIRKNAGCACTGNAKKVFPVTAG